MWVGYLGCYIYEHPFEYLTPGVRLVTLTYVVGPITMLLGWGPVHLILEHDKSASVFNVINYIHDQIPFNAARSSDIPS